jgi:hydroxyacylglutathione hydrolase
MKRTLLILGIVIVAMIVLVGGLIASAFMGRQAIADRTDINGITIVKDGIVSAAVVPVGQGKVALIDAGNDAAGKAILTELSRRGLGPDAVAAIFITHGHADHTGAAHLFPTAQVMAMAAEVGIVEGTEGTHGPITQLMPAKPTGIKVSRPLQDGETVALGGTQVRAFAVPGHTKGSATYLVNGVLFMGDAADAASDLKLQAAPWVFSDSQAGDRASLIRLYERLVAEHADVQAIAFAHSGILKSRLAPLATFAGK